jgi:hypothetical protein
MAQSWCTWYGAKRCGDAMVSTFSELSKNALYRQTTLEKLTQVVNHQGFEQEKNQDRV